MTAYKNYYGLDFAVLFWDFLVGEAKNGHILSIDKVKDEIVTGGDDIAAWFKANFQPYCMSTQTLGILQAYQRLVQHANKSNQYLTKAKNEFMKASNADTWLLVYCRDMQTQGQAVCLVTGEVFNSQIKKKIPIPNICQDFDLQYCNCFDLIRVFQFSF